ncbi:MAG: hypothetical protein B9S32_01115 [Verrucomicrobia bacterium Tous-C9LFEB]|nr:MAG: hypothetical protein B9S32_01115 [Verrucomicrobia bacterium Tous-C9LFEB]
MSIKTLWFTRCPVPTAFSIAIRLGCLDEEFSADGIEFRSLLDSKDREVRESHFSHTQPNSFRHGGNAPPIWARSVGHDVKIIGLSWNPYSNLVFSLPDRGIKTATDLKGRRLGVPRWGSDSIDFSRSIALQAYETALASVGLTFKDVELVDIVIGRRYIDQAGRPDKTGSLFNAKQGRGFHREEILALIKGEVDVIAAGGPRALDNIAFLGANVVYDVASNPNRLAQVNNGFPWTFTANGSLIQERPDLVSRVLARVIEAAEWAKSHHSEVVRIVALEQGVAEEFIELTYGDRLSQELGVNLSTENVEALRARKDFLLRHGFLAGDFDVDAWVDHRPLAEAHRLVAERRKAAGATTKVPASQPELAGTNA